DVEVVRGLVEHEAVDTARGEKCETGAGALARREGRRRAQDVVRAESELREQRARSPLLEVPEDLEQRLRPGKGGAVLFELAEDDARPDPAGSAGEREASGERVQQRRLAAAGLPGGLNRGRPRAR